MLADTFLRLHLLSDNKKEVFNIVLLMVHRRLQQTETALGGHSYAHWTGVWVDSIFGRKVYQGKHHKIKSWSVKLFCIPRAVKSSDALENQENKTFPTHCCRNEGLQLQRSMCEWMIWTARLYETWSRGNDCTLPESVSSVGITISTKVYFALECTELSFTANSDPRAN